MVNHGCPVLTRQYKKHTKGINADLFQASESHPYKKECPAHALGDAFWNRMERTLVLGLPETESETDRCLWSSRRSRTALQRPGPDLHWLRLPGAKGIATSSSWAALLALLGARSYLLVTRASLGKSSSLQLPSGSFSQWYWALQHLASSQSAY